MRPKTKQIALLAAIPVIGLGWYAFRPELLFINQRVNDVAPVADAKTELKKSGEFKSYAHHTEGKAQIFETEGKRVLRLENFETSNGPDVHVYLLKGTDSNAVKDGDYIDLGVIKGNIGSQNYTLPNDLDLDAYGAVSIWCKRFSVNFGGASLMAEKMTKSAPQAQSRFAETGWSLARFQSNEILVTRGTFRGAFSAKVSLVERNETRYIRLSGAKKLPNGAEIYFVKAETLAPGADISKLTKVKLGTLNAKKKSQEFANSKSLDVWLYRTVAVTMPGGTKAIATAELRSDQELNRGLLLL
ncbi:MAG: DM13 domain-containing protein [Fimbriimonadaceae bacterium]|nr:DM13 domain-containing protein [Fimbriimonadaceae bacterium]